MTDPRPSHLATVVAAAARAGDPSDPAVLATAARDARAATDPLNSLRSVEEYAADAPRNARIEEASRALRDAHLAVADAAGEWYDAEQGDADERRDTRDGLRAAVERWRAAGDAFVRATRGGA